jgi:DNA-binding NarL/FixJ family response regulator
MAVRPRVLIVDDEELLVRSMTRMLTRAGYDVVARLTLGSASDALRGEQPPIDVVLTDLRLGSDSGLDLVRLAGQLVPPPGVIVFSGAADADDVDAATSAGARMVIRKPVQPAELISAVAEALLPR